MLAPTADAIINQMPDCPDAVRKSFVVLACLRPRSPMITPAQSDDYVDRHKNDKGNNNQCVQAHLDVILLIYKIYFPTLLTGNALEILWFIPPFLRSVKASL